MKNQNEIFTSGFVDAICRISVVYLSIPVVLFLLFWLNPLSAIFAAALFIYAVSPIFLNNKITKRSQSGVFARGSVVFFGVLASSALSVVSYPAYDSIPLGDAVKHGTLLADLAREKWPVVYLHNESNFIALRYSFAYYLAPAGVSKIIGKEWLSYALTLWTAGGVFLFFMMAASGAKKIYSAYLSIITAGLFSGLSVIYVLAISEANPNVWTSVFSAWARGWGNHWLIGSHPFELAWSPQHALPAWLGAGIIYYCNKEEWFKKVAGVITVSLMLWSPFVAFSFAILLAFVWMADNAQQMQRDLLGLLRTHIREALTVRNGVAALLGLSILIFVTADSAKIPVGFLILRNSPEIFISQYLIFIAIEFGVLLLAIKYTKIHLNRLTISALMILLILPFTSVGAASDLQMRGSQLPYTVLMFLALTAARKSTSTHARAILSIVIFAGLISGFQEIQRKEISVDVNRDKGRYELPMPFAYFGGGDENIRHQYLASINNSSVTSFFFAKHNPSYVIESPVDYFGGNFSTFGTADFNERERFIQNAEFADAAFVSKEILLPAGLYRLDAVLDWDVVSDNQSVNAAHVSLHGQRLLVAIKSSKEVDKQVSAYFQADGTPVKISFGLGGWSKGKGFLRLKELNISLIRKDYLGD